MSCDKYTYLKGYVELEFFRIWCQEVFIKSMCSTNDNSHKNIAVQICTISFETLYISWSSSVKVQCVILKSHFLNLD